MNRTLRDIHGLRSIHGDFSDRGISDAKMDIILSAAVRAASSSARQPYSIILIDDRNTMRELTGYAGARLAVFCVDLHRLSVIAGKLGYTVNEEPPEEMVTLRFDVALAVQTAVIAARSLRIDSLITNGINRTGIDRARERLRLPDGCTPLMSVVFGYSANRRAKPKGRVFDDTIIHRGQYATFTGDRADRVISQFDDPSNRLGLHDGWKADGFAHYHDWFFTKWIGLSKKA